jgi:hypothetical protein
MLRTNHGFVLLENCKLGTLAHTTNTGACTKSTSDRDAQMTWNLKIFPSITNQLGTPHSTAWRITAVVSLESRLVPLRSNWTKICRQQGPLTQTECQSPLDLRPDLYHRITFGRGLGRRNPSSLSKEPGWVRRRSTLLRHISFWARSRLSPTRFRRWPPLLVLNLLIVDGLR